MYGGAKAKSEIQIDLDGIATKNDLNLKGMGLSISGIGKERFLEI